MGFADRASLVRGSAEAVARPATRAEVSFMLKDETKTKTKTRDDELIDMNQTKLALYAHMAYSPSIAVSNASLQVDNITIAR
jgi:hypothetical protein